MVQKKKETNILLQLFVGGSLTCSSDNDSARSSIAALANAVRIKRIVPKVVVSFAFIATFIAAVTSSTIAF
jgi:hypothetical protein